MAERKPLKHKKKKTVVQFIQHPSGPFISWMKFTALTLATGLLLWQLIEKIQSYVENPVLVTREIDYLSEIPFPGLIVCNRQPLRYSLMKQSPMRFMIDHFITRPESQPRMENEDTLNYHMGLANQMDYTEFYKNTSQSAEDFIVDCSWKGNELANCSHEDFTLVSTDIGYCYRLSPRAEQWPNATASGPTDAFQIILNVDTIDTYKTSSSKSLGAQLALFPFENPTPLVSDISFSIPLGFEAYVGIRSEFIQRLPKSKKGQCEPGAKSILFQEYTTAGCLVENKFMRAVNACSCLPHNFPEYRNSDDEFNATEYLNQFPPCNVEQQFMCVEKLWAEEDSLDLRNISCPDGCKYHRYSRSISYATIAANQLRDTFGNAKQESMENNYVRAINAKHNTEGWKGAPSEQYFRENFVIVNIYFQELLTESIIQHLTYDGWALAIDIIATVGIILGFLVGSLGELITSCIWASERFRRKPENEDEESEEDEESDEEYETDEEDEHEEEKSKKNRSIEDGVKEENEHQRKK